MRGNFLDAFRRHTMRARACYSALRKDHLRDHKVMLLLGKLYELAQNKNAGGALIMATRTRMTNDNPKYSARIAQLLSFLAGHEREFSFFGDEFKAVKICRS